MRIIVISLAVGLPLIGHAAPRTDSPPSGHAPAQPPAGFAQCRGCHSVDPAGKAGVGPNLYGIAGAAAGAKTGYNYSAALKAWGKRWDRSNLDAYLANPRATVPGTKMMTPGISDVEKRKQVVEYLLALK